jgi:methanogenic corrinoid protein MtbC1
MILQADLDQLRTALADVDEAKAYEAIDRILSGSPSSQELDQTFQAIQAGMDSVGKKYQEGEYFLAEMLFAADVINHIMPRLTVQLQGEERKKVGRIVLGTVQGDIHDIGKNLVGVLLTAAFFDVIDLGVDVPPERFVAAIKQYQPAIVGLSGLLTLSIDPMKKTVEVIRAAGLRDQVKIIIGGNPVTQHVHETVGSDAWTDNAAKGVALCRQWVGV